MERRWVTISEVAEYLGIHPITARRLCDRGELPAARIGGSVRIDLKALEEKLARQTAQIAGGK